MASARELRRAATRLFRALNGSGSTRRRVEAATAALAVFASRTSLEDGLTDRELKAAFVAVDVLLLCLRGAQRLLLEEELRDDAPELLTGFVDAVRRGRVGARRHLSWIEDRLDWRAGERAIREGGRSVPWEEVRRKLGLPSGVNLPR